MLDWDDAVKLVESYDTRYHRVDLAMGYIWYALSMFAFAFPGVSLAGVMFLAASVWTFFSLNFKPIKAKKKYYCSWYYAAFVFRYRIKLDTRREIHIAEILTFLNKAYPTSKWFYNRQTLYIQNKRMLIAIKIKFPEIVDSYLNTMVPNEK